MPEPSSPLLPAVTRTDTTLGSTACATAPQSGAGAPSVTSGAALWADGELDVVCEEGEESSRFSAMPSVSKLDSTAAPAPTATTPAQPGPRRSVRCAGTGGGVGPHGPPGWAYGWGCVWGCGWVASSGKAGGGP